MKKPYVIAAGAAGILTIAAGTYLTDLGQIDSVRSGDLFYVVTNTVSGGSKSITAHYLLEGLKGLPNWPAAGAWESLGTNALTAKLDSNTWQNLQAPKALAYSGTNVATDAALGNYFQLTLTQNSGLQNPVNGAAGQRIIWELIQDTDGIRTLALGSAFKLGTDVPVVVLTTNGSKRDFLTALCDGSNWYVTGFIRGF